VRRGFRGRCGGSGGGGDGASAAAKTSNWGDMSRKQRQNRKHRSGRAWRVSHDGGMCDFRVTRLSNKVGESGLSIAQERKTKHAQWLRSTLNRG